MPPSATTMAAIDPGFMWTFGAWQHVDFTSSSTTKAYCDAMSKEHNPVCFSCQRTVHETCQQISWSSEAAR